LKELGLEESTLMPHTRLVICFLEIVAIGDVIIGVVSQVDTIGYFTGGLIPLTTNFF